MGGWVQNAHRNLTVEDKGRRREGGAGGEQRRKRKLKGKLDGNGKEKGRQGDWFMSFQSQDDCTIH